MSDLLFGPSLAEMVKEADRELKQRETVYRRMVDNGKLGEATANRRLALMRAIRDFLKTHADHRSKPV